MIKYFAITVYIALIMPLFAQEYPNSVYFGLGGGSEIEDGNFEFSIIGGYDRHIEATPNFSVGLLIEGVFSHESYAVLGIPIGFYPTDAMKLWIAPCYTLAGGGKDYWKGDDGVEYFKVHNDFMLKFGWGYNYHFPKTRYALLPYIEGSIIKSDFLIGIGVKINLYFTDEFK